MKKLITALSFLALIIITTASAQAQTYSFECYCGWLANPDCGCTGNVNGMFFDGLLIKSGGKTVGRVLRGTEPKFTTASTIQFTLDDGRKLDIPRTRTGYTTNTAYKAAIEDCLCIEQVTVHPAATLTNNPGAFTWDVLTQTGNIPPQVVTTLTNTVAGNRIGTYTNEAGAVVQLNETITNLSPETNGIQYVNESGDTTVIDLGYLRDSVSSANGSVVVVQSPNSTGGVNYDLSAKSILLGNGPYQGQPCNGYLGAIDTVGVDTQYYCNNGVLTILRQAKQDSVWTVPDYTALRAVPISYPHDLIHVADWTYTGPDGNTYTTIGGVFKKVLIGNENGGTVIVGAFKWERDHEDDKIRPEWWEVGGYDANGNLYTNKNTSSNGVYNETDRVIAASIVSGIGGTVELLKNKTYPIDRSVTANTGQKWEGNNATLFRVNSQTATLSAGSALGSNTITVTDATQFRVGQRIVILKTTAPNGGYAYDENVGMLDAYIITNIAGNVITLAVPLTAAVNSGWLVVQNTTLLVIETGTTTQLNEVVRLNFDGNRSGNNQSVDWRWHNSIYCVSSVESILIDHCQFTNSPSETIIMAGGTVSNCYYADLNTSFVHISKGVNNVSSTTIIACTGKRSNQVANALASHSESTITSSANTSHVRVEGCYLEDGGESVFTVQNSQVLDYHVSNNTFKDYKYCWFGGASGGVKNEMKLIVNNNVFDNCGPIIMGTATPGSIYKNTGMSHVEINKNTFINTRIDISGIGYLSITYNNFYWDETRTYKYPYSTAGSINSNQAFFRISHMDRVHFIGNVVEHPMTYNADTQFGLMLLHANSVRKTSAGVDTEYLYAQDVKVNNNTFAGFKTSICNWQTASPQYLQESKEAVGWEYKNNTVYMSRAVGSGGGTGIVVAPGCVAESNTIYTNSTAPAYAGMVVQGISNASGTNPQTRLMGGYAIDNKILGCGGATAADIVCNDGVRYNVTVVGNQTRDAIFNAVNGYFAQNWIINTTNYPALTAKTCPEWRFWQENFNQY